MHRWLESLIVCLLALALPGQGVAAATVAHCGQAHQRVHAAAADPDPQATVGHQHAAAHAHSSHAHDAAQANPADRGASTGLDSAQPAQDSVVGPHACSACASCCAGVGLSSAPLQVPQPDSAATVFVTVVPAVDAFAADGPDRPPRIVLA